MTHLTRCGWFAASLLFSLSLQLVRAEDRPETEEPSQDLTQPFVDGAIFGLARNESPYAYLFLEAVSDPIEPSYWRYGCIKGTSSPVTVELDHFVSGQPFNELLHIPGSLNFRGSRTEPFWVFFRRMPTKQNEPDTKPSEVSAQVE